MTLGVKWPRVRALERSRRSLVAWLCMAASAAACAESARAARASFGQEAGPPAVGSPEAPIPPSVEEIRRTLEGLRAIENPSEEDKARIDRLVQSIDLLSRADANRERAGELRELVQQVPSRLERIAAQQPTTTAIPESPTVEQLDQALKVATAELAAAREALAQVEAMGVQLEERRRLLPEELGKARSALNDARLAAEKLPPAASGGPSTTRTLALATLEERQSAVQVLEAELDSFDAQGELIAAQREATQRRIDAAEAAVRLIRSELETARRRAVEEAQERARGEEAGGSQTTPARARLASLSAESAKRLQEVGDLRDQISDEIDQRTQEMARIARDFATDKERARVGGASGQLSQLLRRQRQALPSAREIASEAARIRKLRASIDMERIDRSMEIDALASEERALLKTPEDAELAALVRAQRESLTRLLSVLDDVSTKLATLEAQQHEMAIAVTAYRDFIDRQVLWLRSGPALWQTTADSYRTAIRLVISAITDAAEWRAVHLQLQSHASWGFAGLGVAGVLVLVRPLIRRWLERLAAAVAKGRTDRFVLTIEALVATILMSSAAPALMIGLGMALRSNDGDSRLVEALSAMLLEGSLWVALLIFTKRLVRRQGLAIDHFGWRRDQIELLHRVSKRLFRITVPLVLLAVFFSRVAEHEVTRAIAGLVFVPCQLMLAWAGWTLGSPSTGLFAAHIAQHPNGWISRLRWIWLPLVVGVPLAAAVLMLVGWGYTSALLINRLVQSAALGVGAAVLEGVLLRALEFAARAFAARSRQQVLAVPQGMDAAEAVQKETARRDIAEVSRQTRTTIRAITIAVLLGGLAIIWGDLLPALRIFDDLKAWDGATGPVTWGAVLLALFISMIAIFAARNLPGAIEVLVLQHTGMTQAGRYAATAVIQYAIVIAAVVLVAGRLGIAWSSVQWLVAAVTVGLGFGLQEIVGNFVAGLIVLFEQPVRVGDVVTVGDRTGQVVRIQIRATTIRDPDGKDLIIPNKHLITDRVVNWTLSGAPLRLVLPVGVAYGTDLALAAQLMREAAASVPTILQTPPPNPQLMGFGANSIDFELRVFVARIDQLMPTRHALTLAVQSAFSDAGITIAFPQLDVHIDTGALERLLKEVQQ